MSSKVENRYFKRTAGTAKPCFMCFRETATVLATFNTTDFFYICPSHLSDRGFASLLNPPAPTPATPPGPSKEDVAKVIAEYEAKKRRTGKEGDDKSDEKDGSKSSTPGAYLTPTTAAPSAPSHEVYELHRQVFLMRLDVAKKNANSAQAKAVSKEMPRVPAGFGSTPRPRPTGDGGAIV